MRQVVQALVRHGFVSVVDQLGFSDGSLVDPHTDVTQARLGRRIALTLTDLGPTFVKLGQLLATRDDLLPPAVTTELAGLQDKVRPMSEATVRAEIARALGAPVEKHFALFGPEPLASASVAQVHRALTHSGKSVVVKVQRPGIAETIEEDLTLLDGLAELLHERVEDARRFDPRGVARVFGESLRRELDFTMEAAAYRRMRGAVGGTAYLPAVLDELSSATVLTLEYVEGRKVTAVTEPEARKALARQIVRTFVHQVLQSGYFHADPHAGNLLAMGKSDALVLLDLGAVGTVDPQTRATLLRLSSAAAARDAAGFAAALLAMTVEDATDPVDRAAWDRDVRELLAGLLSRNLREVPLSEITGLLFALVRKHGLRVQGSYFTLVRAAALADGVVRTLDPTLDPLKAAAPYLLQATVVKRDLGSARTLGWSMVAARWRKDPAFRRAVLGTAAAAGVALVVFAVALAWLLTG
jgi:ubiquinone biosynthesis protein